MNTKEKIYQAAQSIRDRRTEWYDTIRSEAEFQKQGGIIYPYDTTGANLDPMFEIFEKSGFISKIDGGDIKTICDIGCANGELAFSCAESGFDVSAIDFSYKHDRAPYVASRISSFGEWNVAIMDMSVDRHFSFDDLLAARLSTSSAQLPQEGYFDLSVCLGLIYHLKNPFAFLESLSKITKYALVGTHIVTHTPNLEYRIDGMPLAYLVDSEELNNDPTNFWLMTDQAFQRLARRSGFTVIDSLLISNNPLNIAVPNRTDLGTRQFLLLESTVI